MLSEAEASRVPVLNMQDGVHHPFQILADAMTIMEKFGRNLKGKNIKVSWAYAASYQKPISVPQSLILLMTRLGMNVTLTHPPEYKLMPEIVGQAQDNAKKSGGSFAITNTFERGLTEAARVYPRLCGRP